MKYSIQKIAQSIKLRREKMGLSQRQLSAKVGIPQSHLSKIERGVVDLQTSSLIEIGRALDLELVLVPLSYLSLIESLQSNPKSLGSIPAYQLQEGGEDE